MTPRGAWPGVALLIVALAGCGWTDGAHGGSVPGCTVPDDEDELLDAYENDRVFRARPDGARRDGDLVRSTGCRQLNKEDVSITSVSLIWYPDREYDGEALRQVFHPLAQEGGWHRVADPDFPPVDAGVVHLTYCREVRGVPSRLLIRSQAMRSADVRPSTADRPPSPQWTTVASASIFLLVHPHPACPQT
ncbi:hypothetical protein [Micromonospora sp. NPDC049799]|uniref:hypothetical protein n=1 Tax=Micromonospora sp. NPDC049799 TaxID=3154741 RepID=UPI00340CCF88